MQARALSWPLLAALAIPACRPAEPAHAPAEEPPARADDPAPAPVPPVSPPGRDLEAELAAARAAWEADPADEDAIVWYGRRLGYLGRYLEAERVYTRGLELHPDSYRLRRHRGHRLISMRRFEEAARDLAQAARLIEGVPDAVEPDGMPNPAGVPRSTTHSNIHYHLGLAWYLQGRFERAEAAWTDGLAFARNDDMLCATSYWVYLSRRRLGDVEGAAAVLEPVRPDMEILENHAYHDLLRLFRGELAEEDVLGDADGDAIQSATRLYGVGAFRLLEGDEAGARELFERAAGPGQGAAFGAIAAEAELRRLR